MREAFFSIYYFFLLYPSSDLRGRSFHLLVSQFQSLNSYCKLNCTCYFYILAAHSFPFAKFKALHQIFLTNSEIIKELSGSCNGQYVQGTLQKWWSAGTSNIPSFPSDCFHLGGTEIDLTAATSIVIPQFLFFVVKKHEVDPPQMLTGVPESQLCSLHEHLVSWGPCKATRQEAVPAERGLCY